MRSTMPSRKTARNISPAYPPKFFFLCDIRINILVANICISYRSPVTQNLNGLDFDLSRSLWVKYIVGVGLPIHDFLFRFNSNALPNSAPLQTRSLRNLNNPGFDLSMSLNVKCNVAVDFLLVSNSKHISISHGLAVIGTWKVYHLAKISDKTKQKMESLLLESEGKVTTKIKLTG